MRRGGTAGHARPGRTKRFARVEQRGGLAAERMDDMAVVDDMQGAVGRATALERPPACQRRHQGAAQQAFQPVVVEPDAQPVADQARRHRVEHAPQQEPATAGHGDQGLVVVGGAPCGQGLQGGALGLDQAAAPSVGPADDFVHEPAVTRKIVEVTGATQQQRLLQGRPEMAVRRLDRAVLVGNAAVVAGRFHGVVGAQRLVAPCLVRCCLGLEIAERRRQAVTAMLARRSAQEPQGVLQSGGQRGEALAAQHDLGMLPAGEGQAEMVEPMRERLRGDAHRQVRGVGEVGEALLSRWMVLAEDHFALRTVQRLPVPDTALQGAAHGGREVGVAAKHLLEHGHGAQARRGLQQRDDLGVPHGRQRIRPTSATGCLALRRKPRIGIEPGASTGTDACLGCGELACVGPAMVHVQSRLLVGDVRAGHEAIPREENRITPAQTPRRRRQAPKDRPRRG